MRYNINYHTRLVLSVLQNKDKMEQDIKGRTFTSLT